MLFTKRKRKISESEILLVHEYQSKIDGLKQLELDNDLTYDDKINVMKNRIIIQKEFLTYLSTLPDK